MPHENDFNKKFRVDELLVFETSLWNVSLRPSQPTVGSLVLSLKRDCTSIGHLTVEESKEFVSACNTIETALRSHLAADKFNYLCLMMLDQQVHFHVIPRYESPIKISGKEYIDTLWPKPVDIFSSVDVDESTILKLLRDNISLN